MNADYKCWSISDGNANIADNADADMDASEDTDTDVTDCWISWQCLCDDASDDTYASDAGADIANIADADIFDANRWCWYLWC